MMLEGSKCRHNIAACLFKLSVSYGIALGPRGWTGRSSDLKVVGLILGP